MHLTGGQFKGRIIEVPKGADTLVKPTLSKVRESVFNILTSYFGDFSNLAFFDMFTGSSVMMLEAYSRGFKKVEGVEKDYKTFLNAKKIIENFEAGVLLLKGDSLKILASKNEEYDVIYIDPPWNYDYAPIIEIALNKLKKGGLIVVEYDKKSAKPLYRMNGTEILPFKEKIYGRCKLDFIKL